MCGYPPRDFLEFDDFLDRCMNSINRIAQASIGITTIIGGPARNPKVEGKNLYNAAFVLRDGKIADEHYKALLPTYDVFDEYRYFEPSKDFHVVEISGKKIALTICEDLWDIEDDLMYTLWYEWRIEKSRRRDYDQYCSITVQLFSRRKAKRSNATQRCKIWNAVGFVFST